MRITCVVALVAMASCSGTGGSAMGGPPPAAHGGDISIYHRNSYLLLEKQSAMRGAIVAASVLGLKDIDILEIGLHGVISRALLGAPDGLEIPENVSNSVPNSLIPIFGSNSNQVIGMVVMDFAQNWVVLSENGQYGSQLARSRAPGQRALLEGYELFYGGGGQRFVIGDAELGIWIFPQQNDGTWTDPVWVTAPWPRGGFSAKRRAIVTIDSSASLVPQVYVQGISQLAQLELSIEGVQNRTTKKLDAMPPEPPYVAPFFGFDHVDGLNGICPGMALGIGVFSDDTQRALRRIEAITIGKDSYGSHELPTPFDVTTFTTVQTGANELIVGVWGTGTLGSNFAAYRWLNCKDWEPIEVLATDFDWRAPPTPSFGPNTPFLPKTRGVSGLGLVLIDETGAKRVCFAHYDGYELRRWDVHLDNKQPPAGGRIDFTKEVVHGERTDLAF